MDLTIYKYNDYKSFLKAYIDRSKPSRGLVTKLAKEAGCQPSYLSQVLNGHVHLMPDHALGIAQFMQLSTTETDYLLLMVDEQRAATGPLRKRLHEKRLALRRQNEDITSRLQRPQAELTEFHMSYYSSWLWLAIHILTAIPEWQTVSALSARLGLPPDGLQAILERLEMEGFVRREHGRWVHSGSELHLSRQSSLIHLHHNNWRQRAILDSQTNLSGESLHFSGVYAVGEDDIKELKSLLLKTIEDFNKRAGPSPSEDAVCFNCDFFRV